jgi:hypothetical protein
MTTAWDGRATAWGHVWQRVQAMTAIREATAKWNTGKGEHKQLPLPEEYWGLRAEAELLVGLTTADTTVGMIAGGWLEHIARAEAERDEVRRSMIADVLSHKKWDSNAAEKLKNEGIPPEGDDGD